MNSPTARRPVIVHVMGWESQQYGSFERQLVLLGDRLAGAGSDLHLVFRDPPRSAAFCNDVSATIHVLPGACGSWDLRYVARCAGLLRRLGATHLHAHHGTDAYLAIAAARVAGVPHRFVTKHITPGRSRLTASRLRHRALATQVATVFAVSRHVADAMVALGVPDDAITVHHMGVDTATYRPDAARRVRMRRALDLPADARVVLATSHLRPGKGVDRMPDVAAALADDPGRCVVVLAGDGPLGAAVAQRSAALGLPSDTVRLIGTCDDVPALLDAADVFVAPTDATEGLSASVLEALASATPAVVTDVPGLRPLIGEVATVVPRGDTGALIAAIRAVLATPDAAARTAAAARTLVVERFSVEHGVDQLVQAYLGLVFRTTTGRQR